MRRIELSCVALGACLAIAGVALVYVPAALVVAGVSLVAFGWPSGGAA